MCISCEIHDKWPPFIFFFLWFFFATLNVVGHVGVWLVAKTQVLDIINPNRTQNTINLQTTFSPNATSGTNSSIETTPEIFRTTPETLWGTLNMSFIGYTSTSFIADMNTTDNDVTPTTLPHDDSNWPSDVEDARNIMFAFVGVGIALYIIHMVILLPKVVISFTSKDPQKYEADPAEPEQHWYFKNYLKYHAILLLLSTILFDIPVGAMVVQLMSELWKTGVTYEGTSPLTELQAMDACKMMLGLSVVPICFIALYKGKFE